MIHILGAPRTGSTLLYQLIINHFHVNYFANDGKIRTADNPVSYNSLYGRTTRPHEPTEASRVLYTWFGKSERVLPEMESTVTNTIDNVDPLVMKNIWNVWRVDEWERLAPCKWVWIRRELIPAAASDYHSHQGAGVVNGAYLRFVGNLAELSPMERAVKQQADINAIIQENMTGRDYIEVWYKDIVRETNKQLLRLEEFLNVERRKNRAIPKLINHNE